MLPLLKFLRRAACRNKAPWIVSAQTYLDRANRLEKAGRLGAALRYFACAARLRPDWAEPRRKRGLLLIRLGLPLRALPHLEAASRLDPGSARSHAELGAAYLANGKAAEALAPLRQALGIDPGNPRSIANLARAHDSLGQLGEIRRLLAPPAFSLNPLWSWPRKWVRPRYAANGRVANMGLLRLLFARPIRLGLAAMDRADLHAELLLRHLGDKEGALRLWGERLRIQRILLSCLGLEQSPIRYMTDIWVRYFGHISHIDFYVKLHQLGLLPPFRPVILFGERNQLGNACLVDYWKQHLEVIVDPSEYRRRRLESRLLDIDMHVFEIKGEPRLHFYHRAAHLADGRWIEAGRKHLLHLDPDHGARGRETLRQAGLPDGAWFVTLHIREPGFTAEGVPSLRNAAIETYLPAIREIVARGGWVVRIGDPTMRPLPAMTGVVDSAHADWKSDWLDIYLLAACRFFIGVNSGPTLIPAMFGVPSVFTNWIPLGHRPDFARCLLIHKTHRDQATGQKLPYSRIVSFDAIQPEALEKSGISIEDNTADEIQAVTVEMLDLLAGTLASDPADDQRQARFREIDGLAPDLRALRIGRRFLEQNAALLD